MLDKSTLYVVEMHSSLQFITQDWKINKILSRVLTQPQIGDYSENNPQISILKHKFRPSFRTGASLQMHFRTNSTIIFTFLISPSANTLKL